jgi:hypothetical protein
MYRSDMHLHVNYKYHDCYYPSSNYYKYYFFNRGFLYTGLKVLELPVDDIEARRMINNWPKVTCTYICIWKHTYFLRVSINMQIYMIIHIYINSRIYAYLSLNVSIKNEQKVEGIFVL